MDIPANVPALLVGAPVYDRAWAMPHWFAHVEAAAAFCGLSPEYIFVGDPDDPTMTLIGDLSRKYNRTASVFWVNEEPHKYVRNWAQPGRYEHMVQLRNKLLEGVRQINPVLYLSLDTDIFLAENAIHSMNEAIEHYRYDAVGGKTYMTPHGYVAPSYAYLMEQDRLHRPDDTRLITVDCIMAIKLMTEPAYGIDYALHYQGEDIGWSKNAKAAGLSLGWDGRVVNRHVMSAEALLQIDPRVGW